MNKKTITELMAEIAEATKDFEEEVSGVYGLSLPVKFDPKEIELTQHYFWSPSRGLVKEWEAK